MSGSIQTKVGGNSVTRFLELLDRYEAYLRSAGKKVSRSAPAEGERLFLALSFEHRQRLISRLETELALFDEAVANGERLTDSPKLVWRYFRKTGYTPCSDIFGKITDSDIVELYGLEQMHLFQNLNFFDWVSTTLEQIYCLPWYQNSTREPAAEQSLANLAGKILAGEVPGTVHPDVGWHVVRECGEEAYEFDFHIKWASPVHSDGRVVGILVVCEAHTLRSSKTAASLEST